MKLTKYNPRSPFHRLQNDMDSLFNYWPTFPSLDESDESTSLMHNWAPSIDLKEEDDRYVLTADVPGVDAKDIEITMEDDVLTIQGERTIRDEKEENGYKRTERVQGKFYRRFTLPDSIDGEGITAKSNNGVLMLVIPKHEKVKPRRITVNT